MVQCRFPKSFSLEIFQPKPCRIFSKTSKTVKSRISNRFVQGPIPFVIQYRKYDEYLLNIVYGQNLSVLFDDIIRCQLEMSFHIARTWITKQNNWRKIVRFNIICCLFCINISYVPKMCEWKKWTVNIKNYNAQCGFAMRMCVIFHIRTIQKMRNVHVLNAVCSA